MKPKNSISKEDREKIIGLIKALLPSAKIYLFGSRARGTHSQFSDIDSAVDAAQELSLLALDELKSILAASNLLYRIDVVDFCVVAEDMQRTIVCEGILWRG